MNLEDIQTVGEAEQYLDIARKELDVQRNTFVRPLRKERQKVQHLIKSLPDELIGTVTVELPMGTITIDDPDHYETLISVLKTYRDRVLHQLDTHEEQYERQRDRMFRLFRQIQASKVQERKRQEGKSEVNKAHPAAKGGAPQ